MKAETQLNSIESMQFSKTDATAATGNQIFQQVIEELNRREKSPNGNPSSNIPPGFPSPDQLFFNTPASHGCSDNDHNSIFQPGKEPNQSCLDLRPESNTELNLPDGSHLHREADRDEITRPDGTKVEITKGGIIVIGRDGKPEEMEVTNSKFAGSDMRTSDGTTISGFSFQNFMGDGTITFPNGDKIDIKNDRVVTTQPKNWPLPAGQ